MLNIQETQPSDWKYVSEGGATIVFSYAGVPNPKFDGTVLRLRKALVPALRNVKKAYVPDAPLPLDPDDEPDDPTIEYQTKCMARLIPPDHLPRLETVRLERPWLESLIELQNLNRPEIRRDKDVVDVDRRKGVLATDLVGGNWLAVEIKPKWAFLPNPLHLSEGTKVIKAQTCRFCMHNHMRSVRGDVIQMGYCPLDLFSQDEQRMRIAVNALWDAWSQSDGTVNNLKVFASGRLVRPAERDLMLAPGVNGSINEQQVRSAFTDALVRVLVNSPVLRILSDLQRSLDTLDIEGLSQLWRYTESSAPLYRTTFASFFESPAASDPPPTTPLGVSSLFLSAPEPNMGDWIDFLDMYLSPFGAQVDHSKPSPKDLRYYLLAYLLSATFKDCSIIVRLAFLQPGTEPKFDSKHNTVTVIDLDPKSLDKLRGWEKLDNEIATIYSSRVEKKICVDAGRT